MAVAKTYLELVQDTFAECQFAGTAPVSVAGNLGAVADIVRWVRDGYVELQQQHRNWRWMRKNFALRTTVGNPNYGYAVVKEDVFGVFVSGVFNFTLYDTNAEISEFSHWWVDDPCDPPRVCTEAEGVNSEGWLSSVSWPDFRASYQLGGMSLQTGRPSVTTVDNQDRLVLWPIPDAAYIVRGEFQRSPQVLQSDTSTPEMPAQFHSLIPYYAMMRYAVNAVAPEVMARARDEGTRMLNALELNQLPSINFGRPLV